MDTPFIYGKIASGKFFANRSLETQRLINNFSAGINTILISPRRWGKSSLVYHASQKCKKLHPDIKFIHIDLFGARNEEQFYELLARSTISTFSSGTDSVLKMARELLSRFLPKISFSPAPEMTFELTMDWEEVKKHPNDILMLPELLATQKKQKVIVCIDEFQNIGHFESPVDFQKLLRASWQLHQNASYCLYGSKRNMMMNVFTSPSMPFYKFGDIVFLEKLNELDWHAFIRQKFETTGKEIDDDALQQITTLTDNHPYYVQQLAHQAWLRSTSVCTAQKVVQSFKDLSGQMSMLFHALTDTLTTTQVQFLKALINKEKQISSGEVLKKYRLGTSANIQRIRQALLDKEIIDHTGKTWYLLDPLYQYWLKENYFGNGLLDC